MTDDLITNATAGGKTAVDTFQAMASIYLTSAERLSALNISAAREAVEDQTTTLTRALMGIRSPGEANDIQSTLAQPMIEKALAYSRNTYEILAETQSQLSKLVMSQVSGLSGRLPLPIDWSAAFDMFRTGARQFSDMAAQNVTNAADAVAATANAASAGMKKSA